MEIRNLITEFSKTIPESEVIIGYGSEVKKQTNDFGMDRQIDLIIGVEDTIKWHELNHELNSSNYKSKLGYQLLPVYEKLGTKINYLSYLPFEDNMFKIGVVNTSDLIYDLVCWKNFFLAGRLQKPVEIIRTTPELDYSIQRNRFNALKVSLLALGKREATLEELFCILCSLSYIGDIRRTMHVETKHKVRNIVEGSFDELENIYIEFNDGYYENSYSHGISINYEKLVTELDTLPEPLQSKIINELLREKMDKDKLMSLRKIILKYFTKLNFKTSIAQPLKGFALNGFSKTITYLGQKIGKK